jgi:hypothetical protein
VTADVDHLYVKRIKLVSFSYIVTEDTSSTLPTVFSYIVTEDTQSTLPKKIYFHNHWRLITGSDEELSCG